MNYVLDASAVLRYVDNDAGAERVEELLNAALRSARDLCISAVNWGEVVGALRKRHRAASRAMIAALLQLPLAIIDADRIQAEDAALVKQDFDIPYADSFAAILARRESATLVTADFDFKRLPADFVTVEYLATK